MSGQVPTRSIWDRVAGIAEDIRLLDTGEVDALGTGPSDEVVGSNRALCKGTEDTGQLVFGARQRARIHPEETSICQFKVKEKAR